MPTALATALRTPGPAAANPPARAPQAARPRRATRRGRPAPRRTARRARHRDTFPKGATSRRRGATPGRGAGPHRGADAPPVAAVDQRTRRRRPGAGRRPRRPPEPSATGASEDHRRHSDHHDAADRDHDRRRAAAPTPARLRRPGRAPTSRTSDDAEQDGAGQRDRGLDEERLGAGTEEREHQRRGARASPPFTPSRTSSGRAAAHEREVHQDRGQDVGQVAV